MYSQFVGRCVGLLLACVFSVGACGFSVSVFGAEADDHWPTWRGPNFDGISVDGNPPLTWSETEHVKWKVSVPDTDNSTPVVWGDRIIFLSSEPTAEDRRTRPSKTSNREIFTKMPTVPYRFNVVCLSREDGRTLWSTTVAEAIPYEGHHPDTGFSPYSPITDGEYIWASFGSRGLHCLRMDGTIKWSVDLMEMLTFRGFGEGSSPVIAGDTIIVVGDHGGQSKIWAFNKLTGEKRWEKDRDEKTCWPTPVIATVDGRPQAIVVAVNAVRAYDVETGDIVWHASGLTREAIPSPLLGFGMVYVMSGSQDPFLMAIELGHTGDLNGTAAIKWDLDRNQPYISTPLLYGNKLYTLDSMKSSLSCYNAETGEPFYEGQRLTGLKQMYSSAIGAAGRVYLTDRNGTTIVIRHSEKYEVLATNTLDDEIDTSFAIVGNELYIKGKHFMYCIAGE